MAGTHHPTIHDLVRQARNRGLIDSSRTQDGLLLVTKESVTYRLRPADAASFLQSLIRATAPRNGEGRPAAVSRRVS